MTSRISLSKQLRANMKNRIWSLAAVLVVLFLNLPVAAAALVTQERQNTVEGLADELARQRADLMMADSFLGIVRDGWSFYMFLAFMLAVSGFSYLYRARETDFYHSLPVTRRELFRTSYLTGALFFLVPYALNLAAAAVIVRMRIGAALDLFELLRAASVHAVYFLLIYSLGITAVMLTGNALAGILGSMVLLVYGSAAGGLFDLLADAYLVTRLSDEALLGKILSCMAPSGLYVQAVYSVNTGLYLAAGLAGALLLTLAARKLYSARSLECAGRAMAFRRTEPFLKFFLSIPAALFSGLLFYQIMGADGWALFGVLFAGILACCVIEIIYHGDFRRLFARPLVTILSLAASVGLLLVFRLDLAGYDRYVPAKEDVAGVTVLIPDMTPETRWNYYTSPEIDTDRYTERLWVNFIPKTDPELLRAMGEITDPAAADGLIWNGVETAALMRSSGYLGPRRNRLAAETGSDGHRYADVLVRWRLKNGREVRRIYRADLAALKADAEKLYSDPGFLHAAYPALKPEASEFAAVNYREWDDPRHVEFSSEAEKDRLISTWQAEFEVLTAEQREKESPIGALQFKTRGMQEMIDALRAGKGNYTSFNDYYYYPVYPSFTKTIALLEDLGIEAGKGIAAEDITSIGVHYYGPFGFREDEKLYDSGYPRATREDEGTFVVSDPEQIREVMEHAVPTGLGISNPFRRTLNRMDAEVAVQDGSSGGYRRYVSIGFAPDDVPEFLLEHFGLSREEIAEDTSGLF